MRRAIASASDLYTLSVFLPAQPQRRTRRNIAGRRRGRSTGVGRRLSGWIASSRQALWRYEFSHWGARGISFDEAFENALAGALGIASGHGTPDI